MYDIVSYNPVYRDDVTRLLKEFYQESLNGYGFEMTESIERLESQLLTFLLLTGGKAVGIISGLISNQMLSKKTVFQEFFWCIDKAHRGKGIALLNHLEKWCEDYGISQIIMAYTHDENSDRLGRLYERMGYKPFETHLIKDVNHG